MIDAKELKVGDQVGVADRYSAGVLTVRKVTATQLVLSDYSRWSIRSGRRHGTTSWSSLITVDDAKERIATIRQEKLRNELANKMRQTSTRSLSMDQLQRIAAIIDEGAVVSDARLRSVSSNEAE